MSNYFFIENTEAEERIGKLIERAKGEILGCLRKQVKAIVLVGSLARGEGAWKKVDGRLVIISDVDLLVITRSTTRIPVRLQESLNNLKSESGIEVALWIKSVVSMKVSRSEVDLRDIKETGLVLYGEKDILADMEPDESETGFENAVFLFFNRAMLAILECSPQDFMATDGSANQRLSLSASAIMMTCTDIITIAQGAYFPSPVKRVEFTRSTSSRLNADTDNEQFLRDLLAALSYKLEQTERLYLENADEFWLRAKDYLMKLFLYYFRQKYGTEDIFAYPDIVGKEHSLIRIVLNLATSFKTAYILARSGKRPRFCFNAKNLFYGKMAALSLFLALGKELDRGYINKAAYYLQRVHHFDPEMADSEAMWLDLRGRLRDLHQKLGVI